MTPPVSKTTKRCPRRTRRLAAVLFLPLLATVRPCVAQEWTRFRGPNGSGLAPAAQIPVSWTEEDANWRVELPGPGISQPVLWGSRIFVASARKDGKERILQCLNTEVGKVLWSRTFPAETHSKHQRNTYASSTPAADGEHVYAAFSDPKSLVLRALTHDGKDAWAHEFGPFDCKHGGGASPIVFKELVVLANEVDADSFVIALDRKTGETRWKSARTTEEAAFGTPCVLEPAGGPPELVFSSHAHGLSSLDARTGKENWSARVFDKRTVSSPVIAGTLVLGTCGSGGGGNYLAAVRAGGKGDVTASHLAYKVTKAMPYVPTTLVKGDLVFLWGDMGVVSCVDAMTGEIVWQARAEGNYSGSPVCVGDRLYCLSEEGEAVAIEADREFKLLGRSPLGEGTRSTPAIAGGRMYIRTYTHLISVGGKVE